MAKTKVGAPTRSFSHLLGLGPKPSMKGAKAEGEEPKKPDDEKGDDKEAKGGARAEQEPDTDDDGKAQCAVCEGTGTDEDGEKCEACDGTGEVGEGDEPKRDNEAAKADGDEDEGEAKGRKVERTRWARVMSHPNTTGAKVPLACHLLSTAPGMKAAAVISALADVPTMATPSPRDSLYSRMGGDSRPANPGGGAAAKVPAGQEFGAAVAAAVGKVRPQASK